MQNSNDYNSIKIKILEKQFLFAPKTYNSKFLSQFITSKEYNKIISDANFILNNSKIKKMKYEKISINKWVKISSFIILALIIIFIILLYYSPRVKNGNINKIFGIIIGTIGLVLIFGMELYNIIFGLKKKKDIEDFFMEELNDFIEETNKNFCENIYFTFLPEERMMICYSKKIIEEKNDNNNNLINEIENNVEQEDSKRITFSKNSNSKSSVGKNINSKNSFSKNSISKSNHSRNSINNSDNNDKNNMSNNSKNCNKSDNKSIIIENINKSEERNEGNENELIKEEEAEEQIKPSLERINEKEEEGISIDSNIITKPLNIGSQKDNKIIDNNINNNEE